MTERVDVVVVGGGTAGLNAAGHLARLGRSVVVLERRAEGKSGARWCNGLIPWQLDRAGVDLPEPPEVRSQGGASQMISPSGDYRVRIGHSPTWEVDMRAMGDRLRADALEAGVDIRWEVKHVALDLTDGRPTTIRAAQGGAPLTISADLFVDASGLDGVLRTQVPELAQHCPMVGAADLCSAQQLVLDIADVEGAHRFLESHGAKAGDGLVTLGIAGGYSTVNIKIEESLQEVSVLTGSIPALGVATGPELLRQARSENPWMGKTLFGGGGLIPIRRVYDQFTAPGIALVGDSASQVMPGHGSGIGFGLIAGKMLAEAVGTAPDPGDPDALWDYQANYLHDYGAILAGYDVIRRMSTDLGTDGVEAMFAAGFFSEDLVVPGLEQRLNMLGPRESLQELRTLSKHRDLAKKVLPTLTRSGAARALYRSYPKKRSARAMATWTAASKRMLPAQADSLQPRRS